ncbi:hypothetical protein, partial [Vibrio aestuarianus]|uniref:hypothetical protein n=1 Tax=Vibrio aestuarianus TaxID=28171 RepID=UPI0021C31FD5
MVQVPALLNLNWSIALIHNVLKDTPLSNHRDYRLVNHRIELAEIAEREQREAAERARIALLNDPAHQAKLKVEREATAAKIRKQVSECSRVRPLYTNNPNQDPIPSIQWRLWCHIPNYIKQKHTQETKPMINQDSYTYLNQLSSKLNNIFNSCEFKTQCGLEARYINFHRKGDNAKTIQVPTLANRSVKLNLADKSQNGKPTIITHKQGSLVVSKPCKEGLMLSTAIEVY